MLGIALAFKGGVELRMLAQRGDDGAGDKRQGGDAQPAPRCLHPGHVDLYPGGAMGCRLERALHVGADLAAHP